MDDKTLIESVPSGLSNTVSQHITTLNDSVNAKIQQLQSENALAKAKYVTEANETYGYIMTCIQLACTSLKKTLNCEVKGCVHDRCVTPTVSYWKACNPVKYLVAEHISHELIRAGWDPKIDISPYSKSIFGIEYRGGLELVITRDFNDK